MTVLAEALKLASRGWPVFPLSGKRPLTDHGFLDASTDEGQIHEWWSEWPNAGIGVATGERSCLLVIDIDPRHGGDLSLADLEFSHEPLPPTLAVATGGGGQHLYFRLPDGDRHWVREIAPGVEIKAEGGYVVAPPSGHPSGGIYTWANDTEIAEAPAWVAALATKPEPKPRAVSPLLEAVPAEAYAEAALRAELELVRRATEGGRNHQLNRSSFALGQLIGAGHLARPRVEAELYNAAIASGLGEHETIKTMKSGLDDGEKEPRVIRPREPRAGRADCDKEETSNVDSPRFNLTDLGNAERLVREHGRDLRYVSDWKRWLVWDGKRWAADTTGEVMRRASNVSRVLDGEALREADDDKRKAIRKWANQSESAYSHAQLVRLAESREEVSARPSDFDTDPMRLTVENGTIDLRTGKLLPHSRKDNITKLAPVVYDADAPCPLWDEFLYKVLPSQELRGLVQRLAGYILTGDTSEHVFPILWGSGANGKSILVETWTEMLGEHATGARADTFLCRRDHDGGRASPDVARLRGARFVPCNETPTGAALDEALVKELTGGDTITARHLYGEPFEFRPQFKIVLRTNHKPRIEGGDEGIWRRVLLIPFAVQIPPEQRDRHLREKLRAELPGILAWAVRGCLEWQAKGLGSSPEAETATRAYRDEHDVIGRFIRDSCELGASLWTSSRDLVVAYEAWCRASDEEPLSPRALATALSGRGLTTERRYHNGKRTRGWIGIGTLRDTSRTNFPIGKVIGEFDEVASQSVPSLSDPGPKDQWEALPYSENKIAEA